MRQSSLARMAHRLIDRTDQAFGVAIRRSRTAERIWVGLLDAVVAQQADRRYLRRSILPALARARPRRILFVGVRGYTASYRGYFSEATEFWTSDIDPAAKRYGSPGRHLVADVRGLDAHFQRDFFDVALLNGVFGWGVDSPADMDRTLEALARILRVGGHLLIGWNSDHGCDPATLSSIGLFDPAGFADLPPRRSFADVTHVYAWFRKR